MNRFSKFEILLKATVKENLNFLSWKCQNTFTCITTILFTCVNPHTPYSAPTLLTSTIQKLRTQKFTNLLWHICKGFINFQLCEDMCPHSGVGKYSNFLKYTQKNWQVSWYNKIKVWSRGIEKVSPDYWASGQTTILQ